MHDTLGKGFAKSMGQVGDLFGWTLLYFLIVPIFFLWALRFLYQLPRKTALLFIVSGGIFVFGAIGLELLNLSRIQAVLNIELSSLGGYIVGLLEESCEMLGIFLFNITLFLYCQKYLDNQPIYLSKKLYIIAMVFGLFDICVTYTYQCLNNEW